MMEKRLDNELVERKYFVTRNKAQSAIKEGLVFCNGMQITKPSYNINDDTLIEIKGNIMPYVSKGGLKLEKALMEFNINLNNKIMLDIGSSTGGFTDCAIQNSIKKVIAIDVGTNQLDKKLLNNPKVKLYEQMDFRDIDIDIISNVNITTIDVSFISVKKLIQKINELSNNKEIICLIKPQFECGKEVADKYKGIVLNKNIHIEIIRNIIKEFEKINYFCNDITYSPIVGGSGNIEYLAYFTKEANNEKINIEKIVDNAFDNFNIKEKK